MRRILKVRQGAFALFAVIALAVLPACADEQSGTTSGATITGEQVFVDESARQSFADKADKAASNIANMYRDVRHAISLDPTDKEKVQTTCTITIRDAASDQILGTIKSAVASPTGEAQPLPVSVDQVPGKIVGQISKLPNKIWQSLASPQGKSVEVMVQIKRDGYSKLTATLSLSMEDDNKTPSMGQSFVSQDEIIPNSCSTPDIIQTTPQE